MLTRRLLRPSCVLRQQCPTLRRNKSPRRRDASTSVDASPSTYSLPPTISQLLAAQVARDAASPSLAAIPATPTATRTISGWIKSTRRQKNVAFVVLTDGSSHSGLQVVVPCNAVDRAGEAILKRLTNGAAVQITGTLVKSRGAGQTHELLVEGPVHRDVVVLGDCDPETYPIQKKHLSNEYLREHVHLRARTAHIAGIVRLRSQLAREMGAWFEEQGFHAVNTPIITSNDAEGAGESFKIAPFENLAHPAASAPTSSSSPLPSPPSPPTPTEFFTCPAHLTVSHQLHLEALATALSRVYTLSPCFRAEPSLTGRHLAEFWMLEAEWAFGGLGAPGGPKRVDTKTPVETPDPIHPVQTPSPKPPTEPHPTALADLCNFVEAMLRRVIKPVLSASADLHSHSPSGGEKDGSQKWKGDEEAAERRRMLVKAVCSEEWWARMTYTEAIRYLQEATSGGSSSSPPPTPSSTTTPAPRFLTIPPAQFVYPPIWGQPLQSEHERYLASTLVKGPVFVTDYPAMTKPFYMRENPSLEGEGAVPGEKGQGEGEGNGEKPNAEKGNGNDDPARTTVACFDLLVPGVGELVGGSVREERVEVLARKMREAGLLPGESSPHIPRAPSYIPGASSPQGEAGSEPSAYQWYLDLRTYGGAPHGGFGMGFERLVQWVGGVENIRECIPMPRWAGRLTL